MALAVLAAALAAAAAAPRPAAAKDVCWVKQSFAGYRNNHVYAKSDAEDDFPGTKGPFKMVKNGDKGGSQNTRIDDGAIRGSFEKGAPPLPPCYRGPCTAPEALAPAAWERPGT